MPIPSDYSNLKCWLIANDLATGAVTTWTDASGSGNSATQGTAANRPTCVASAMNGQKVVRGDGLNDFLDIPAIRSSAGQVDIWIVSQRLSSCDNYPRLMSCWDGSGNDFDSPSWILNINWDGSGNGLTYSARIDRVTSSTTLGLYAIRLLAARNNTAQADSADIAEVVVYDATKSQTERAWISYYLANKYGISGYPPPVAAGGLINSQSLVGRGDLTSGRQLVGFST